MNTPEDVLAHLRRRLPDVRPDGAPERLEGGLLNVVWRVPARPESVIVKWAPPYLASAPDVPLDPSRVVFEAHALEALGPGGLLGDVVRADVPPSCSDSLPRSGGVRPPRRLDLDAEAHVLVMEDVGRGPDLGAWLRQGHPTAEWGGRLGAFVGRLHRASLDRADLAARFRNLAVQETRHAVQYQAVGELCRQVGLPDAEELGRRAEALGRRLQDPGRCLLMGDLWPASVLVAGDGLRVIDWEFAHFGHPAQDVAHLAAHLWMHARRAPNPDVEAEATWRRFRAAYAEALGPDVRGLWTPDVQRDAAIHYAAEVLVRAVGAFQEGYLYGGLAPEAPPVQEAVAEAARHLRDSERAGARLIGPWR